MLLKALSQRIDRGRIGWQTGGGHVRERASRPSPPPSDAQSSFQHPPMWLCSLLTAGHKSTGTGIVDECVLQTDPC